MSKDQTSDTDEAGPGGEHLAEIVETHDLERATELRYLLEYVAVGVHVRLRKEKYPAILREADDGQYPIIRQLLELWPDRFQLLGRSPMDPSKAQKLRLELRRAGTVLPFISREIQDLYTSLLSIDLVHIALSDRRMADALLAMFDVSFFAERGHVHLIEQDQIKVKTSNMGKKNRDTPRNRKIRSVYDAYLESTPTKTNDGVTGVAQRAFRNLKKDWKLQTEQVKARDQHVERPFSDSATKSVLRLLTELRELGWTPRKDYRSLRNYQKNKQ